MYRILTFSVLCLVFNACSKSELCADEKLENYLPGKYSIKYTNTANNIYSTSYGTIDFYSDGSFETQPSDLLFQSDLEGIELVYHDWDIYNKRLRLSAIDRSETRHLSIEYAEDFRDCDELILYSNNHESKIELLRE